MKITTYIGFSKAGKCSVVFTKGEGEMMKLASWDF